MSDQDDTLVARYAPQWAWNVIFETLECDMQSSAFDKDLKQEIGDAYCSVRVRP